MMCDEKEDGYKSEWQAKYRNSSTSRECSSVKNGRLSPFNWRDLLLRDAGVDDTRKQKIGLVADCVDEIEEEQHLKKWIDEVRVNAEEGARLKLAERRSFRDETRLQNLDSLSADNSLFAANAVENIVPELGENILWISDDRVTAPLVANNATAEPIPRSVRDDAQTILSDISNRVNQQRQNDALSRNASNQCSGKDIFRATIPSGRLLSKPTAMQKNVEHLPSGTSYRESKESNKEIRSRIRERLKNQHTRAAGMEDNILPSRVPSSCAGIIAHSQMHIEQSSECSNSNRLARITLLDNIKRKREKKIKMKCFRSFYQFIAAEKRRLDSIKKAVLVGIQRQIVRRWKIFVRERRIVVDSFTHNTDRRSLRRSFSSWRDRAVAVQFHLKKWKQVRMWQVKSSLFARWKREARHRRCDREAAQFASERAKLAIQESKATQFRTKNLVGACFFRWCILTKNQQDERRFRDRLTRQKSIIHEFLQSVKDNEGVYHEIILPDGSEAKKVTLNNFQCSSNTRNDVPEVAESICLAGAQRVEYEEEGNANCEDLKANTFTAVSTSTGEKSSQRSNFVIDSGSKRKHNVTKPSRLLRREENCQANIWAKERDKRRSIMQERRETIRITRLERLKEETQRKEDEAYLALQKVKEAEAFSRRKVQEAKREKFRAVEKRNEQSKLAKLHYQIHTLKRYGFVPWRSYLYSRRIMEKKASIFYRDITLYSRWTDWRQFVTKIRKESDEKNLRRLNEADEFCLEKLLQRCFGKWRKKVIDIRRHASLQYVISRWKEFTMIERDRFRNVAHEAFTMGDHHRLKYYFSNWKFTCDSIKYSRDIDDKVNEKMQDISEWLQRDNISEKDFERRNNR